MLKQFRRRAIERQFGGPVVPEVAVEVDAVDIFRAENFPDAGPVPWLDRPDALERIDERHAVGGLTDEQAELCRKWVADGYVILPKFFDDIRLDYVWDAYEASVADAVIDLPRDLQGEGDTLPGRALNPHFRIPAVEEMLYDADMVTVVELLLGVAAQPFQTISGHKASQQPLHSDTIHMTTYPAGFLVANWIAFEDIEPDSGPLEYVPGSHRLPVHHSREVGITKAEFDDVGYVAYQNKYEPFIAEQVAAAGLESTFFQAKRGDVLLWHANLLHGGSKRDNLARSRRALVCHYFAQGCICYHDLAGNKAWVHEMPPGRYPIED